MRGKVAKRIRKKVYMAQSLRIPRRYKKLSNGAIVNVGLRAIYQREKRDYLNQRRIVPEGGFKRGRKKRT